MNDDVIDGDLEEEQLDDTDVAEDADIDADDPDEEELDEEELDVDLDDELAEPTDEVAVAEPGAPAADGATKADDDEDADDVPSARKRPGTTEDDEDDTADPDDVEADLDSILKDRIASNDDEDEDDDEPEPVGDPGERVAAKAADEFTCNTCFLIVHPRQFGRAGNLSCPEGYDPCPSIKKVEAALKRARKT